MDNKTREIQMSVAWNNSSRIMAGLMTCAKDFTESIKTEDLANKVEALAHDLYARQIKFLEEINQPK